MDEDDAIDELAEAWGVEPEAVESWLDDHGLDAVEAYEQWEFVDEGWGATGEPLDPDYAGYLADLFDVDEADIFEWYYEDYPEE